MLGLTSTNRPVLKYLVSHPLFDQISTQSSYRSFRSKSATSGTVSKPVVTKKKYSELPALSPHAHAPCEHPTDAVPVSSTPLMLASPECGLFTMPNVRSHLLTWSWFTPVIVVTSSTPRARRRRVKRVETTVDCGVPEPVEQSKSTRKARNVTATAMRSRKLLPPASPGKSCEW
jgi:hypothetical protein